MPIKITIWQTKDGRQFTNEHAANQWEQNPSFRQFSLRAELAHLVEQQKQDKFILFNRFPITAQYNQEMREVQSRVARRASTITMLHKQMGQNKAIIRSQEMTA